MTEDAVQRIADCLMRLRAEGVSPREMWLQGQAVARTKDERQLLLTVILQKYHGTPRDCR